jgi:hypothetical protein
LFENTDPQRAALAGTDSLGAGVTTPFCGAAAGEVITTVSVRAVFSSELSFKTRGRTHT